MATKWKIPAREHLLSRGPMAQKANDFLSRAWQRGWLPAPPLSPDALWDSVAKGSSDPVLCENGGRTGDEVKDFRLRLAALCGSINAEADLNSLGQAMAYGQLTRVIKNRLALGLLWHARPALLDTRLAAPIIVIGHMRSGTTRIHKLLASDPAHSHTRYQDAYHPVPAKLGINRVRSALDLAMLGALNPWLQSIHPMGPKEVEEELAWISAALHHSIYESQWHIPSYSAFSEARDPAPIYSEFARILRTDAATRGIAHLPRVMKVPAFSEDLPALLAEFPDARLVIATRDREAVLKSAVSLCANQMAVQSDTCDVARITSLWEHKIAMRDKRMAKALAGWNGPIAQLHFDELNNDWEAAIRRCYAHLDLPLKDEALAAMRKAMASSSKSPHQAHSEQLQRFAQQG
ncbi:sulfotransferase [Erythrobacter sp. SCSIO 43205]|uniref:sulfotransferase family protein n=1 Tax=Erythrobacter sp. SCSIO 43205 TaxID=2779361 RepID=UPI001CA9BB56|nr:sulfotransferase [Erythrobacter sp. SCSIO 43205]UAB77557.1 sulfotransferase [Erythrobacter sp. SCSIO 43205]